MNTLALELTTAVPSQSTLTGIDWVMIALYFAVLLGVDWWVVRKNKNTAAA